MVIFFAAYCVSFVFFELVDFTIDTLLLCFCLDDQKHSSDGGYFASVRLLKFMALAPKMKNHELPTTEAKATTEAKPAK